MRMIVEVPDREFLAEKSPEQVAEDVRRAAAAYWIASGDLTPEAANEITIPGDSTPGPTLMEVLLRMPGVSTALVTRNVKDVARTGVSIVNPFEPLPAS